VTGGHGRI